MPFMLTDVSESFTATTALILCNPKRRRLKRSQRFSRGSSTKGASNQQKPSQSHWL
ncbi:MAG: hypothetical protein ACFCUE_00975 [Candidatus Bathyarchaeia archaeon]